MTRTRRGWPVAALLLCSLTVPALAIQVNTTADAIADDGKCGLREAIIAANTDSLYRGCDGRYGDVIEVPAGRYELTIPGAWEDESLTGDLDVLASLEIRGAGEGKTILDGNGLDRVLDLKSSPLMAVRVTIKDLDIVNGRARQDPDNLRADDDLGGGIRTVAPYLDVARVTLRDNLADGYGGGLSVSCPFGDCSSAPWVTLDHVTVVGNRAPFGGGISQVRSTVCEIRRSTIQGNEAFGTPGIGGGLYVYLPTGGSFELHDSAVVGNTSRHGGGGLHLGVRGDIVGGVIAGSVIAQNHAEERPGGGIYFHQGYLQIRNATISSNTTSYPHELGGGIGVNGYNSPANLRLENVTLYDATPSTGSVLNVYGDSWVLAANTIFLGRCSGELVTSSEGNLESPGDTCNLVSNYDTPRVPVADLNLQPLGLYGGPTASHYPRPPSAAVDGGFSHHCTSYDQRGISRPRDGNDDFSAECDVGAIEVVACDAPKSLTLESFTEYGPYTYTACEEIRAGNGYRIGSGGDVTLRAGVMVVLGDGFAVESGGRLTIDVDVQAGRNP